jgi:hypothetical protein
MAGTPTFFQPSESILVTPFASHNLSEKAQIYPGVTGTAADRPAFGQLWPRGSLRGHI